MSYHAKVENVPGIEDHDAFIACDACGKRYTDPGLKPHKGVLWFACFGVSLPKWNTTLHPDCTRSDVCDDCVSEGRPIPTAGWAREPKEAPDAK